MIEALRQLQGMTTAQVLAVLIVGGLLYLGAAKWKKSQRKWVQHRVDEAWGGAVDPLEKAHAGLAARLKVLEERFDWIIGRVTGAESSARTAHDRLDGREGRKP